MQHFWNWGKTIRVLSNFIAEQFGIFQIVTLEKYCLQWRWCIIFIVYSRVQRNLALLIRAQVTRGDVGQVAHAPPTPCVTSQEADITHRTPEATCWIRLECWSNNVLNSHPSPGAFNCRVLRACLVSQCSYPSSTTPSTTPCELSLDACDLQQWTTFQSSQASNLLSFVAMESHYLWDAVPWSLDTCATQHSPVHRVQMHGASNRDTHLYPPLNNSSGCLTTTTYVRRSGQIISGMRSGRTTPKDFAFSFPTSAPTLRNDPPKKSLDPA